MADTTHDTAEQTGPSAAPDPDRLDPKSCDRAVSLGRVGLSLIATARSHRIAAARDLKAAGIYPGQELVLQYVAESGPARMCGIVESVNLDPSTVTRTVQRLEKSGFLYRETDPDDRRASRIALTDAGRDALRGARKAWADLEERTTRGFSEAELAELVGYLERIERNLAPCAEGMDEEPA
ncbi:MarR family winged helix-turn-helix transcriptional regulator [Salininema proteolyticum]|uniref:MarR family winged helix-turn-helix transcriptional regulator n=1 Tax=Salininema proteolyticum TaxID=1607685 RepID=A0ABV8TUB8_9ACTN